MPIYKNEELTNEQYRELPEVSGSDLVVIHNDCPAAWKYGEPKESPALAEGIAAHVALLEPQDFAARFYRDIEPGEHPEAMDTAKDMQAFLKDAGRKGYSGKVKSELIDMVLECDESAQIIDLMREKLAKENGDAAPLKAAAYDRIELMRQTIRLNSEYADKLTGGIAESSIVVPSMGLKVRPDYITADGEIWDYKTTVNAHPEKFGKQAHDAGYWLKMALQADLYAAEYGEPPKDIVLLAQTKSAPYICQAYSMTAEQLEIGREQYQAAFRLYQRCVELDSWPAYGGGVQELVTPVWAARMYGFDDDFIEIKEAD